MRYTDCKVIQTPTEILHAEISPFDVFVSHHRNLENIHRALVLGMLLEAFAEPTHSQ